jgi:hypothetical protein
MAVKRTVTKSKKDGVKKKTVTTSTGRGSVTKTKAKGKTGKAKTTTVTAKKRTHGGTKPKVVATSSKTKGNRKATVESSGNTYRAKGTQKQKNVLTSDGRMISSNKTKGADYGRSTERSIGGVAGKRYAEMDKIKIGAGKSKKRSSGKSIGTMKGVKQYPDHRPLSGRRTGRRG